RVGAARYQNELRVQLDLAPDQLWKLAVVTDRDSDRAERCLEDALLFARVDAPRFVLEARHLQLLDDPDRASRRVQARAVVEAPARGDELGKTRREDVHRVLPGEPREGVDQ